MRTYLGVETAGDCLAISEHDGQDCFRYDSIERICRVGELNYEGIGYDVRNNDTDATFIRIGSESSTLKSRSSSTTVVGKNSRSIYIDGIFRRCYMVITYDCFVMLSDVLRSFLGVLLLGVRERERKAANAEKEIG